MVNFCSANEKTCSFSELSGIGNSRALVQCDELSYIGPLDALLFASLAEGDCYI